MISASAVGNDGDAASRGRGFAGRRPQLTDLDTVPFGDPGELERHHGAHAVPEQAQRAEPGPVARVEQLGGQVTDGRRLRGGSADLRAADTA